MSKTGQNLLIISTNYIKTIKATTLFVVFLFVHSWEQRKLSELTSMHARIGWQNLRTSEFLNNGEYMLITGTDFDDGAINYSTCHYVDRERYEQDKNIQIRNGSILITKDGTLGKVAYVQGLSMPATLNAGVFNVQIKASNLVDEKYLFQYLKAPYLMDYVGKKATGGTIKHLNQNILVDFPIFMPKKSEQIMIGAYYQLLDNLITLHQRKGFSLFLQFLRQKKQSFLPISWEQRKLCEITTISKGQQINKAELENIGKYYVLNGGMTASGFTDKYNTLAGTISISEGGNSCGFVNFNSEPFWSGGHNYTLINPIINVRFLYQILKFIEPKIMALRVGSGLPNVQKNRLGDVDIVFPTNGEQKKIGLYLEKLDNLITLHQCECFYIYKKYLLFLELQNSIQMNYSWEQRKFEEIAGRSSTVSSDANLPRVEYEDIVSGTGRLNKNVYAKQSGKSGIAFHQGDVLYGKLRPYLQNWLLPAFDGLAVGDFWVLRPQNVDSNFLYRLIQSRQFDEVANQSTGTKMPRADWKLVSKTVFSIPSNIDEQAAIGTYFTALDNLITLHQCESCKKVVAVQSPFARRNLSKWTDSWEQRKFGETVQIERGGSPRPIDDFITTAPDGLNWVKIGDAPEQGNYITKTAEKIKPSGLSKTREVHPNDLILSNSMSFGKPYIMAINGCIHDGWLLIRDNQERFDLKFLCHLLGTAQMLSQYKSMAAGSTVNNLNKELVGNTTITFPTKQEQQKIGKSFELLDNLITLHQREVFSKNIIFKNIKFGGLGTENNTSWEQRKLSDMCSIITKQTGFDYSETIKPSLITEPREDTYSFIQNKDFDGENINFDTDFYIPISIANKYPRITLDCPSLLISISGKIGNVGYYNYLKKSFIGGAVGICKLLRANGSIIVYALQSNAGQRYFHSLIKASSHANITVQDIRNINVMLPRNEAEEIKVSQLLRSIDNLITLHQRIKIFITGDYHDKKNK